MKIIEEYPPNIGTIERTFGPIVKQGGIVFTYGDTLYNPHRLNIEDHLLAHEQVHTLQQGDNPGSWWYRYLTEIPFRLEQEIEAYAVQYRFVKEHFNNKIVKWFIDRIATDLSSEIYGKMIAKWQAETRIRQISKKIG